MSLARIERGLLWLGPALLLAVIVWPRILAGLATDEAGSWWIVKEDYGQAVSRSWSWSATSPLYYSVLWLWTRVFGLGELGMRLLSVLFALAAVWLVYRLALRWLDESGARIAVLVFLAVPSVTVAFIDIRPYAMGLTLCAATWLFLQRWLERDRRVDALLFVLCAAATIWCHYTLALGLLPLAWYLPRLGVKRTLYAAALLCLLLAPLALEVMQVIGRRGELTHGSNPALLTLLKRGIRRSYWLMLTGGSLIALSAVLDQRFFRLPRLKQSWAPVVLLAALPVTVVWLLGQFGRTPMFHDRYMVTASIGVAITCAWLIGGIQPQLLRTLFIAVVVTKFVLAGAAKPSYHLNIDWRSLNAWGVAFIAANPGVRVALASPFVESQQERILNDPRYEEILHGPFARYLGTGRGLLFPGAPAAESGRRLDHWLSAPATGCAPLLFLSGTAAIQYRDWLTPRLEQRGYRLADEREFGDGRAWVFTACGGAGQSSIGRR
jgi:hypothetical protein